jgi:flagellar hook-associated protein 3 FlgL
VSARITQNMLSRSLLLDLHNVTDKLSRTQRKISSGKELTAPSDDPFAASQALMLRQNVALDQQYQRNVAEAQSWQSVTDTALSNVTDAVLRVRDLVVQGASDTLGPQGRQAIANEVTQLIDSVKSAGNSQYAGRYVFSGSATLTQPYQLGANDAYGGNAEVVKREIGPGVQVDLNTVGQSTFGDDTSGLLKTLRDIVTDLNSGNTAALGNADLKAIDVAHDAVVNCRSVVGALSNRLDSAMSRLQQLQDASAKQLSDTEDADMAKTLVDFSTQQAVYQSALRAGANIIQPSLMDFLSG